MERESTIGKRRGRRGKEDIRKRRIQKKTDVSCSGEVDNFRSNCCRSASQRKGDVSRTTPFLQEEKEIVYKKKGGG